MVNKLEIVLITAVLLLQVLSQAVAHDDGSQVTGSWVMGASEASQPTPSSSAAAFTMSSTSAIPSSYFAYPDFSRLMLAHIALMTIAWFFILPVGVMLSLAKSRLASFTRLSFLGMNGVGLLLAKIYNSKVPDLYENNSHHFIGWAVSWIVLVQSVIGIVSAFTTTERNRNARPEELTALIPVSANAMEQLQAKYSSHIPEGYRHSHDSGHGTEPESSRGHSISSLQGGEERTLKPKVADDTDAIVEYDEKPVTTFTPIHDFFLSHIPGTLWIRNSGILNGFYNTVDRFILPLGFVTIVSGMAVYGGVFRRMSVLNGLAHTIKGGIFFWYGLLTLGRWMGCFVEYGWAWNVRPPAGIVSSRKATVPSAEFVESFVIFLYGSTNVFLEHLAAWGGPWHAQDLEHVSISIMFFGGGLCGMLLESRRIRDLLNMTVLTLPSKHGLNSTINRWDPPKTYSFSMNPFPALIILLLGLLMSSHHQASAVSTMIHKQWGTLLVGFALARAFTYVLAYISPPTSFLPSRPPTEIVASFCLLSGGLIFMASNKDTVAAIEKYGLDGMFCFTLTIGFTAFLMAWTIVVLAVRGWAVRRQQPAVIAS